MALPALPAAALDCGQPLATRDCQDRSGAAGCGILYLQISNLVEDGPVLNGLSLMPDRAAGAADRQCRGSAAGPLPPADTGSPDRDCIAYLLPACTYGVAAEFGDGSRSMAEGIQVEAVPDGAAAHRGDCAKVTVDLGRRDVSAAALQGCPTPHRDMPTANMAAADLPVAVASRGDVTGVTHSDAHRAEP